MLFEPSLLVCGCGSERKILGERSLRFATCGAPIITSKSGGHFSWCSYRPRADHLAMTSSKQGQIHIWIEDVPATRAERVAHRAAALVPSERLGVVDLAEDGAVERHGAA